MHDDLPTWRSGTVIGWHYRRPHWRPGDAQNAFPVRVVADDERGVAAWLAPGTQGIGAVRRDGTSLRSDRSTMFTVPRRTVVQTWSGTGVLRISPRGRPWSVWVFGRDLDGRRRHAWYINLEDPARRTADGLHSSDHVLDVVVEPDSRELLKDEDELAQAVRQGRYRPEQAEEFLADAQAAIAEHRAGGWPFTAEWSEWRPPADWTALPLPEPWRALCT